ncbi:MAG: MFS transporter [Chloroflexi bacterium]|nr:MFS transporter [Chloroflexota bacterium]
MTATLSQLTWTEAKVNPRYRFVIAALILAAHLSIGLNFFSVTPLLPLVIDDYEVNRASAGLLIALPTVVKALIGLPGSLVINRLGLNRSFTLSWFMLGMLAFSPLATEFHTMILLRLLYGLGAGLMMTASASLIMQWFPTNEVPIVNTLLLVVVSLGVAASISLAVPLSNSMSWEAVLGVFGAIGLLGAIAWTLLGKTGSSTQEASALFALRDVWNVFRDRTIFLLVVGDALVFIHYAAVTSWLPSFLHEFRGVSLEQAGYITSLLPAIGVVAVLIGGFLSIRIKARRPFFIIPGIIVGLGGFGSFLLADLNAIYLSVIMIGVGTWIYQPILLTLPMQLPWMTPRKIAVVWGASLTIAGLGMFLSPIVVGASRDLFQTFVPGFTIWAILAWALVITGLYLPNHSRS